jgi:hypothetical protein
MTIKVCPICDRQIQAKGYAAHLASHGTGSSSILDEIIGPVHAFVSQVKIILGLFLAWTIFGFAKDQIWQFMRNGTDVFAVHPKGLTPFGALDTIIGCWGDTIKRGNFSAMHDDCGHKLLDGLWFVNRTAYDVVTDRLTKKPTVASGW